MAMKYDLSLLRHSLQHVMVLAVRRLFGFEIPLGVGPALENGCYQDLDFSLTPDHFPAIAQEMGRIIEEDLSVEMRLVPINEAIDFFTRVNQPYKIELLNDIKRFGTSRVDQQGEHESQEVVDRSQAGLVSLYSFGEHIDLCRGPHVARTGELRGLSFQIDRIAGAFWRGNEKNKMLCRLYALVFPSAEELRSYLSLREEAKRRDHRKLGERLELFFFHPSAPGMAYWLPKGVILKNKLIDFWREYHQKAGYQEIQSPILNKRALWETSGHWRFYQEDMFRCESAGDEFALKPMNCANAMVVFQFKPRSYRDLPLRLSDTDILHRNERTGSLNGLFRARCFCQDDSHNFVTAEQVRSEIESILQIVRDFYSIFGLLENVHLYLSTRPDDFMGDIESWERAESELATVLSASGIPYDIKEKDGAFYGPKIDIHLRDSLNREWQCGTIQLDFQLPRNFALEYTDRDGSRQVPIVIHRVIYGSLERFIGIVLEHFAGRLPFWIAPLQLRVLPVRKGQSPYLAEITGILESVYLDQPLSHNRLRFDVDDREESLGRRVRDAELEKIPVLLIFGPRDEVNGTVVLRVRGEDRIIDLSDLSDVVLELSARI